MAAYMSSVTDQLESLFKLHTNFINKAQFLPQGYGCIDFWYERSIRIITEVPGQFHKQSTILSPELWLHRFLV